MLTQARKLTTPSQVLEALHDCERREEQVLSDLSQLGEHLPELPLYLIDLHRPLLDDALFNSEKIHDAISTTGKLTSDLGQYLGKLDTELRHLDHAMDRIDLLFDLYGCITDLKTAMQIRDWETAAGYIHRHLQRKHHPQEKGTAALSTDLVAYFPHESSIAKDMRQATELLEATRGQLTEAIEQDFKVAASSKPPEMVQLQRYFKLFPLIDEHALGLRLYTDFLCQHLKSSCQTALQALDEEVTPPVYVTLIAKLYENIALLVDQTLALLDAHYGKEHGTVFERLYDASSALAASWLETWAEQRRLEPLFRMVQSSKDLLGRDIEVLLADLVVLLQRHFFYQRFLDSRQILHPADSSLAKWMHRLCERYLPFELYCFKSNVQQALQMEHFQHEEHATSSSVDDTFYLLKKSTLRAISTCAFKEVAVLLQSFVQFLEQGFVTLLQRKASQYLALYKEDGLPESRKFMMIQLNNLNQIMLYMPKFIEEIETQLTHLLPTSDPQREPIDTVMASFNKLSHAQLPFISIQLNTVFQFFMKSHVQAFLAHVNTNYLCSEESYAEAVASNDFIASNPKFVTAFQAIVGETKKELAAGNFNALLLIVTEYLLKEWERFIFTRKFTQFGALYLERDLRSLFNFLNGYGCPTDDLSSTLLAWSHGLKEKFLRLQQLSMILNFTHVSEIYDYWGSNAITVVPWKWQASQILKILSLRVDFTNDIIQKVSLGPT